MTRGGQLSSCLSTLTMRLFLTPTTFLLAAAYVRATALTAILAGNERSCYYADVDGVGEKVGASSSPCAIPNVDTDSQGSTLRSSPAVLSM